MSEKLDKQPECCTWTYDNWDCFYQTACGKTWQLEDGNMSDNDVHYCHNCGRLAVEIRQDDEEEQ